MKLIKYLFITKNLFMRNYNLIDNTKKSLEEVITSDYRIQNIEPLIVYESRIKKYGKIFKNIINKERLPIDIYGLRIIYDIPGSDNYTNMNYIGYNILDIIHKNFQIYNNEVDDYIKYPKENGYKSLHTNIYYKKCIFEIQIRDVYMHHHTLYGNSSNYHK
jgi:(p)ppGpp synthase/HD superfamily hydrolase